MTQRLFVLGIKYIKKAIMLDHLHGTTRVIGVAYFIMGKYEEAIKYCGDIYRNKNGDEATMSEYLLVTDFGIHPFSVKE